MENQLVFGTYNIPPITDHSLTASFSTQTHLTKEMLEKIYASETEPSRENIGELNTFDTILKGVLSVPKPTK